MAIICLVLMATCKAFSQSYGVVDKAEAGRNGDSVEVFLTLNPEMLTVDYREVLTVLPKLVAPDDSLELPAVHVLGRGTYYRYIRHDNLGIILPFDYVIWEKRRYRPFAYLETAEWQPWMDRASLKLEIQLVDCNWLDISTTATVQKAEGQQVAPAPMPNTAAGMQMMPGTITDRMTIIFPLDRTEIHPELYNNQRELDKIRESIDKVRNDKTSELQGVTIKGYASPEGPYSNNVRLARGRTDSIGAFVARQYQIDSTKVHTEYEPEDWEGFIKFIEEASTDKLPHRDQLLAIARRTDLKPDRREWLMRRSYPKDFDYLLTYCLPYLRHTDYRIDFLYHPQAMQMPSQTAARIDTVWSMPVPRLEHEPVYTPLRPFDAVLALKTNLLFDAVLGFNGEIELPLGNRWSLMGEFWKPWYVWHHNSRAYQLQILGGELRYWFRRCPSWTPRLTGFFVAPYYAWGKYDFEWNSVGDQGEFHSIGLTAGYSWPISRHWNLELSASVGTLGGGWLGGERRHYHGEFDDTHLIWKYTTTSSYTGPTKLKLSIVWLIGHKRHDEGKEVAQW